MLFSNTNRKTFSLSINLSFSRSSPSNARQTTEPPASAKALPSLPCDSIASPRSPLPQPASPPLKQEQPLLAIPLTDALDPSEKMKLLRTSRKLSRILGEVPILVPVEDVATPVAETRQGASLSEPSTSASTSASAARTQPPPLTDRDGSLKRSATVAHNRFSQQSGIHRARSLASLRPALSIPRPALSARPSRDTGFRERLPPPLPPSPISLVSPSSESIKKSLPALPHRRDSVMSSSSRRNSTSSLGLSPEKTPEQVQRARAAKLTRQLGENVPPDVLLRAASPAPRSPMTSPSFVSLTLTEASSAAHDRPLPPTPDELAKRPRPNRSVKRRLSLDVRSEASLSSGTLKARGCSAKPNSRR